MATLHSRSSPLRARLGALLLLGGVTAAAGPGPEPVSPAPTAAPAAPGRPAGTDEASFLELFLRVDELGPTLRRVQDTRRSGPDPGDRAFARNQGVRAGFQVFMGAAEAAVWRVVDIRWSFPTPAQAEAYLSEAIDVISERQPPVEGAPSVGAGCRVSGGTRDTPFGTTMTAYVYAFRLGNVVAKVFVAQGPSVEGAGLTTADVAAIARRAAARIEAAVR